MKRVIAILVFVLAMAMVSVHAESSVSFIGGIEFGDDEKTIMEKFPSLDKGSGNFFCYFGSIAGIDESVGYYNLNEKGELSEVRYKFYEGIDIAIQQSLNGGDGGVYNEFYDDLKTTLSDKYGDPLDIPDNKVFNIYGSAFTDASSDDYIEAKTEWLVPEEDNYVKIDLVLFCFSCDNGDFHSLRLSYKFVTKEEFESIAIDMEHNAESIDQWL